MCVYSMCVYMCVYSIYTVQVLYIYIYIYIRSLSKAYSKVVFLFTIKKLVLFFLTIF